MRVIIRGLETETPDCRAVEEAYKTTTRNTKLQRAFVLEVARCCLYDKSFDDRREEIQARSMEKIPGLCLDLATALVEEMDRAGDVLDIDDFLVNENPQVDEDRDDDEPITDG